MMAFMHCQRGGCGLRDMLAQLVVASCAGGSLATGALNGTLRDAAMKHGLLFGSQFKLESLSIEKYRDLHSKQFGVSTVG